MNKKKKNFQKIFVSIDTDKDWLEKKTIVWSYFEYQCKRSK